MSKDEMNALLQAVKRSHWDPIIGVKMFSRRHPNIEIGPEVWGLVVGVGRIPFVSIKGLPEGPFPVYKERPWYDSRLWDTDEQRAWEAEMATL